MKKIRKVQFNNHPVLGNLLLDFCDQHGNAVDTVIIAGENGTGKSTTLEELYHFAIRHEYKDIMSIEIENDERVFKYNSRSDHQAYMRGMLEKFTGIYSDVEINFYSEDVKSVTALSLDNTKTSSRSNKDLPKLINQLLVDIQAQDDSEVAMAVTKNPQTRCKDLCVNKKMDRFTKAFNQMFESLRYSCVRNVDGKKKIIFSKNDVDVPIEKLSSGEKQIIYRGCFLLKDKNALEGAFVFIDEPEISMHPTWQNKIMDYYKNIFTDENGQQTSQIFVVTHSPFIIHNKNRKNDKVIVLKRNDNGDIVASDRCEYYNCETIEAVQDAFSINNFDSEEPIVYLEGRTDEKYFNRAVDVYKLNIPFEFKWIGHMDEKNQEVNTGKSALDKAYQFLVSKRQTHKTIFLYDCDAKKNYEESNNVICMSIEQYNNAQEIAAGIENALILDGMDISEYRTEKTKVDDYQCKTIIQCFEKMKLCEDICALDDEQLKIIFRNLKMTIERICSMVNG